MTTAPIASTSSSHHHHHHPRVSSPLATTTLASDEGEEDGAEDEMDSDDGDDDDDDGLSDDSDDEEEDEASLRALLQAARSRARERDMTASSKGANLEDVKLDEMEEDDRLSAVFTRHADPATVFAAAATNTNTTEQNKVTAAQTSAKGKGRANPEDNDDDGPILPGVKSTWGELPRRKKTPSEKRLEASKTSGKKWFDLPHRPLASLSDAEKRELQALRLSNAMDPKRFMRGEAKRDGKKLPEYFQTGYIIESSQSARAGLAAPSNKVSRTSFVEGLMSDSKGQEWARRKYAQVQEKAQSGGKGHYKNVLKKRGSAAADGFGDKGKGKGKKRH